MFFTKILFSVLIVLSVAFATASAFSNNKIQGRLNLVNGASAECVMHAFYRASGWVQIEGEVGRNGIDGLYYKKKNGIIREVLVAESKWNKANLGKSGKKRLIRQMSKTWILKTLERLQQYRPLPEYPQIRKLVEHDQYRARLFRLFPREKGKIQIQIFQIKNKGIHNLDIKLLRSLPAISMDESKNSFEKAVLYAYNRCRAKYLRHYFPMLDELEIDHLLGINYLRKENIRLLIK